MMKKQSILGTLLLSILAFSCSSDSTEEQEDLQSTDLIIGIWQFESENDYRCNTRDVVIERLPVDGEPIQTMEISADGTFRDFDDGVLVNSEESMGTWQNIGDEMYKFTITLNGEERSTPVLVRFLGDNNMDYDIDPNCHDFNGESIYTFSFWTRQE